MIRSDRRRLGEVYARYRGQARATKVNPLLVQALMAVSVAEVGAPDRSQPRSPAINHQWKGMSMISISQQAGRVLALIVLVTASIVSTANPANAAPWGTALDGTNPTTAAGGYCANGSKPIYSSPIMFSGQNVGTYEVRYSPTCGTNWVRVYMKVGTEHVDKYIERPAQPGFSRYSQYEVDRPGTGWTYGMQVYAPGSTHIKTSIHVVSCCMSLSLSRNF